MKKSTLKLVLIITGSILAAAGIIFAIIKFCKKKAKAKDAEAETETDETETQDENWDIDEKIIESLELDEEAEKEEAPAEAADESAAAADESAE